MSTLILIVMLAVAYFGPRWYEGEPMPWSSEARASRAAHREPRSRSGPWNRARWIVVASGAGVMLGTAVGIGAAMLLYRGSNIAPAYGVIFGAPLGAMVGLLFGSLKQT